MSSQSDKFQVILPSTVKSNSRNKFYFYETELSKPINLPGIWNVALINISYRHNWENLDKSCSYFLLILNNPDKVKSEFEPRAIYYEVEIYNIVTKLPELQGWVVDRGLKIEQGNYKISEILEVIKTQYHLAFSNKISNLYIDHHQYRVEINLNVKFAIACYSDRSVLQLFGFGSQAIVT